MIDTTEPRGRLAARLYDRLAGRWSHYDRLERYLDGTARVPEIANRAVRSSYQRLMGMARMNYGELAVEATRERMVPVGFRTGADSDASGDAEAWRIWQANALDADQSVLHRAMLGFGDAYAIVGPVDPEIDAPVISVEDPRDVVAMVDPVRRRRSIAALKVFRDEDAETDRLYLYLPGEVHRAEASYDHGEVFPSTFDADRWTWEEGEPQRLPAPVVPVVRFVNKVGLRGFGQAEFESNTPLLDRINYQILQRLEIATLQAFRQRAVFGVPDRDEDGQQIDYDDIFTADPAALWILPETAKMWESGQVDLGPVRLAIRDDVMDFAAATRTPLYYLTPDAANGSAEGASLAREGLVFKVGERMLQSGESWEQVMSLAFTFAGDPVRAGRRDMEVLWAPAERYSLAERVDAAVKAQAAGVPWRTVMTDFLQFSPQQVDRMAADRAADSLLTALGLPTGSVPPGPGLAQPVV